MLRTGPADVKGSNAAEAHSAAESESAADAPQDDKSVLMTSKQGGFSG